MLLLLWQTLQTVSSHFYHYIYYYSLHNGEFLLFLPSIFKYLCMGLEIFPLLSHHATPISIPLLLCMFYDEWCDSKYCRFIFEMWCNWQRSEARKNSLIKRVTFWKLLPSRISAIRWSARRWRTESMYLNYLQPWMSCRNASLQLSTQSRRICCIESGPS